MLGTVNNSRCTLGAAAGALGISAVIVQLVIIREMISAFAGNEIVIGIVLGNWLFAAGIGAWLGRWAWRLRRPAPVLACVQAAAGVLPLFQVFALRAFRNVIFIRGTETGIAGTVLASFFLLLPYCLLSGFALAMLSWISVQRSGAKGAGLIYSADCAGSVAGGVLFTFFLVRVLETFSILCLAAALNLTMAWFLMRQEMAHEPGIGRRRLPRALIVAGFALLIAVKAGNLERRSVQMQYPGQKALFSGNSPYGNLTVTLSSGQHSFFSNGLPIVCSGNRGQIEETVHYAMVQRPYARRVLLISGGISGTAKEILKYPVQQVAYAELDPLIIQAGREFLPERLADRRIRIVLADARRFVRHTRERFDVIIMDLPQPSTLQLNRFYTSEFFHEARSILTPGGVLCFPMGEYANYISGELARMLSSCQRTAATAFRNSQMIPGGRIYFLGSDGPLFLDIAARLGSAGIDTKFVRRSYLDAMLTPDRFLDLQRAASVPARVNRDFDPMLYTYRLLHWMEQFGAGFGLIGAGVAALLVYALSIRAAAFAVFSAGFAASSLQVVLLLGVQILCGSMYHQVGLIVTVFMAGLAVGAFAASAKFISRPWAFLMQAMFGIAAYAAFLPFALGGLSWSHSGASAWVLAVQALLALMSFLLAILVGGVFSLSVSMDRGQADSAPSRMVAADFIGAGAGSLLASAVLIPAVGIYGICAIAAVLPAVAGVVVLFRGK